MKMLKVIGIFAFAAVLFGAVVLMAGGVSGVLKIALAVAVVPLLLVLLTPRFWLGFFAGDVWRLLFRSRGRR
jgi:hypothetical protein